MRWLAQWLRVYASQLKIYLQFMRAIFAHPSFRFEQHLRSDRSKCLKTAASSDGTSFALAMSNSWPVPVHGSNNKVTEERGSNEIE